MDLGADGKELTNQEANFRSSLKESQLESDSFIFMMRFKMGIPFKTIQKLTRIDAWFLNQIEELVELEKEIEKYTLDTLSRDLMLEAKQKGLCRSTGSTSVALPRESGT
jgi:carbamoyl-phosphate synthase large subunit